MKPIHQSPRVYQNVSSLEFANYRKLGNSGRFFKKLAFMGLALNCVLFRAYHTDTIRSIILSLWNMIAAYSFIF